MNKDEQEKLKNLALYKIYATDKELSYIGIGIFIVLVVISLVALALKMIGVV